MKKKTRDNRRSLAEQHEALRRLREEQGYSISDIAALAGVSEYQAQKWLGGQLARRHSRELLIRAAAEVSVPAGAMAKEQRGAPSKKDQAHRDRLLVECDLTPAAVRVRTLLHMIDELEATREAFARMLGVHRTTLFDYLDPENELKPTLPVALRIQRLKRDIARGRAPASLRKRFLAAARLVFGEIIFKQGFADQRALQPKMITWLNQLSGVNERTFYRWLPPYGENIRPATRIVEAFELAASQRRASPLRATRKHR